VQDGWGRVHDYRYTASNKVISHSRQHVKPDGTTEWLSENWSYASYLVSSHTDPDGTTQSTYDWSAGNLTKLVEHGGRTTTYDYDAFNNRTKMTDHLGRDTKYEYDPNHRLIKTVDHSGNETTTTYFPNGRPNTLTNALGNETSFTYDSFGYPATVTNAEGEVTTFVYDAGGRKVTEQDEFGQKTTYTYDDRDNVRTVMNPHNHESYHVYDSYGRKTKFTDEELRATNYGYDDVHNVLELTTDARGGTVRLTRDTTGGNITAVTDPNNHRTTFAYDDLNRKISETDARNMTWKYEYVGRERIQKVTDAVGNTATYVYDSANRIQSITYAGGGMTQTVNYGYDGVGNRTSMADWTGTTTWTYDSLNRVTSVTKGAQTTGYAYDSVGNLLSLTYAPGKTVQYTYDKANRVKTVKDWENRTTTYYYNEVGRMNNFYLPNGVQTAFAWSAGGWLQRIAHDRPGGILASCNYGYDKVGNRTSKRLANNTQESYTYDDLHRLSVVNYPNGDAGSYSYDNAGNRTIRSVRIGSGGSWQNFYYSFDEADRLVGASYDDNGAMTGDGAGRTFSWNLQHLLQDVREGNVVTSFLYDGDGRRVQQVFNGGQTDYVVNTLPKIPEVLVGTTFGSPVYYVYGHDLLYTIEASGPHYLHADGLGSTILGTNNTGQVETSVEYDAFGAVRTMTGSRYTPRQFTGEEADAVRLLYLRARYYDFASGRFLSRDPFPLDAADTQTINRYVYAKNNPTNYVDPSGEYALLDDLAFGAAGLLVGVAAQGVSDLLTRRPFDSKNYVAAAAGGFVGGVASLYLTPIGGGAVGGAVSSYISQRVHGTGEVNYAALATDSLFGAATGFVHGPRISGITAGGNSFMAVSKQVTTKLERGTIAQITPQTARKIFTAHTVDGSVSALLERLINDMVSLLARLRSQKQ
jgi:RHS repeat-associated protein